MAKKNKSNESIETVTARWEANTVNKKGIIVENLLYGESKKQSLQDTLFIWSKNTDGVIPEIIDALCETDMSASHSGVAVFVEKTDGKNDPVSCGNAQMLQDRREAIGKLALSKTAVFIGEIPAFFDRREGQNVIVISGRELIGKGDQRKEKARVLSGLLNADLIISLGDDDEMYTAGHYRLEGLYKGGYTSCSLENLGETVRKYAEGSLEDTVRFDTDKRKLLIVFDWEESSLSGYLLQLLNYVDLDRTDVTLLSWRSPQTFDEDGILDSVDERVRVIFRVGDLVCSRKEFVETKAAIDLAKLEKDPDRMKAVIDEIPQGILLEENRRMLGRNSFDSLIFIMRNNSTRDNSLMKHLAANMDCGRRCTLLDTDYSEDVSLMDDESRAEREADLGENRILMDRMIFTSEYLAGNAGAVYESGSICSWDIPFTAGDMDREPAETSFRDERYIVIKNNAGPDAYRLLLKCPDRTKRNVVAAADTGDVSEIISAFENSAGGYGRLYLIGDPAAGLTAAVQGSSACDSITIIEKTPLINSLNLKDYLRCFDECWTTGGENDGVRLLCELSGISVFKAEGGKKTEVIPEKPDFSGYEKMCRDRAERLIF